MKKGDKVFIYDGFKIHDATIKKVSKTQVWAGSDKKPEFADFEITTLKNKTMPQYKLFFSMNDYYSFKDKERILESIISKIVTYDISINTLKEIEKILQNNSPFLKSD